MAKLIALYLFDYYCTLFQNRIENSLLKTGFKALFFRQDIVAKLISLHLFDYYSTLFQNRIESSLLKTQRIDANAHLHY